MKHRLQIAATATVIGILLLALAPQLEGELGSLLPKTNDPLPRNNAAKPLQPAICNEHTLATHDNAQEALKIAGINPTAGEFIKQVEKGHLCEIKLMLASGVQMVDFDGFTPLMAAADSGHEEIGKLLLEQGADPNAVTRTKASPGLTALIIAAEEGWVELAKNLLAHGADPNLAINGGIRTGETALIASLLYKHKHPQITALLLKNGADTKPTLTTGEYTGLNALSCAVTWSDIETVKALLEHGADANMPLPDGQWRGLTPLMMAMLDDVDRPDLARLLLTYGANPDTKIQSGKFAGNTARKFAIDNNHSASLKVFTEWNARPPASSGR